MGTAIRGLGKFNGPESRKEILKQLNSNSFRNQLASAAIDAIRQQNDPSYAKPLLKVLRKHEDRFTSRGFGSGLTTLAEVSKSQNKKDPVREFLLGKVNHPKTTVRTSAIRALGTLGDPKAMAAIEALVGSAESGIAQAARDASGKIRDEKPTAPKEVIELRKEVAEMKKANEKVEKELKELRDLLKALGDTDE